MFQVIASSTTSFEVTFRRLGACRAKAIAEILGEGFRDLRIVSEETGEVRWNEYRSSEWFAPLLSEMGAVNAAKAYLASL